MKLFGNLLFWVVISILAGIGCGLCFPDGLIRVFSTINGLFGNFLMFFVPLLILGLVTSGIAQMGSRAGRIFLFTVLLAWTFTIASGFFTYGVCELAFPTIFPSDVQISDVAMEKERLIPYFTIDFPPMFDVLTALLAAFMFGMGIAAVRAKTLLAVAQEFDQLLQCVIRNFIIPLLPLYIFGIFLKMTAEGQVGPILGLFVKLILLVFAITIVVLACQYLLSGLVGRRNPFKLFWNMLPAYVTALGTQSSAATIPVTLRQTIRNGTPPQVARLVIPLCATIHLSGSMIKIVACSLAIVMVTDVEVASPQFCKYVCMLSLTMVAAPGVPGGAIMAAIGLLESMLGFGEDEVGLMVALYIAMDSFGTACNVTGDGAIATIIARFAGPLESDAEEEDHESSSLARGA